MRKVEVEKLKPGDKVIPLLGDYKGEIVIVESVDFAGAKNGWVTCVHHGTHLLYAGEEIKPA